MRWASDRAKGADPPRYPWPATHGPWFDNNLALVTVGERSLDLTWVTGVVVDDVDRPALQTVYAAHITPLASSPRLVEGLSKV